MPVYTVGSTTCGKPFVVDGIKFGDKTFLPVIARVVNSRGDGHYANGISPDYNGCSLLIIIHMSKNSILA